jgi:hypothetical protein
MTKMIKNYSFTAYIIMSYYSNFIQIYNNENDENEEDEESIESQIEDFLMNEEAIEIGLTQIAMDEALLIDTSVSCNQEEIIIPSNNSWNSFLKDFGSASKYKKIIHDFFFWNKIIRQKQETESIEDDLIEYFDYLHGITDNKGNLIYSAPTLRVFFSIFSTYWKHMKMGDLPRIACLILINIKKWSKKHTTKTSKIFSNLELGE